MFICTVHNTIGFLRIAKKMNLYYIGIVRHKLILHMDGQKGFILPSDRWINCVKNVCEEITVHGQLIWLCVKKLVSTDGRLHYLRSICLIQLIRWIHLILKPEMKNKNEVPIFVNDHRNDFDICIIIVFVFKFLESM